ncbi:phosphorylated adapter RNA export protein-like [Antedon mediterranea]|uniref:phosphorylated adapter RNA export protein-like n=1 Tax=Antedon mediterranea TaxID=105859 RepID=UPI003AF78AE6
MEENSLCLVKNDTDNGSKVEASRNSDMEDGELPDSDDDLNCKKNQASAAYAKFRQNSYRNAIDTDDDDDSDDENLWKRKKQKVFQPPKIKDDKNSVRNPVIAKRTGDKKVNNIWGAVMLEQTQDMVSSRLTTVGLDFSANRGVESYNHQRDLETETHLPFGTHTQCQQPRRDIPQVADDLFSEQIDPVEVKEDENIDDNDGENRKQNVKERLGKRPQHLSSVTAKKIDINPDDGVKIVAGNIAYSLWEPKRHLVRKTVEMIGTEKSVEIYNQVIEIEESGGLLINNKRRRRSPGGVFFHLLRNSYGIETEILEEIFAVDAEYPQYKQKEKKDKKKRKKSNNIKMEVSETKVELLDSII